MNYLRPKNIFVTFRIIGYFKLTTLLGVDAAIDTC